MTIPQRASTLLLATMLVISILAGTAALAGTAGAADAAGTANSQSDDTTLTAPDAEIGNGSGYWIGQTLSTDAYDAGASVELFRQDNDSWVFLTEVLVNDSGVAVVDTSGFDVGQYELRSENGSNLQFDLRQQSLTVTADPGYVSVDPDIAPETTFHVESNRAEYRLVVLADELTPTELETRLDAEGRPYDADGDDDATEEVDGLVLTNRTFGTASTLDANLSLLGTGVAELSFVVMDTHAQASTNVSIAHIDTGTAGFGQPLYTTTVGETVVVDVQISAADASVLTISADGGYEANLTLLDENGDGEVLVSVNTTTNGTVSYAAQGPDTLSVDTGEGPFEPGAYQLEVRIGEDPSENAQNVGTLELDPVGTTRTTVDADNPTVTPTSSDPPSTGTTQGDATTPTSTTQGDTATTNTPTTAERSPTTDGGGSPGFGVAVAMVALVAAALLARRVD